VIFDMEKSDNFASFKDGDTGLSIFVDSFNNEEFEVRIGSINESEVAGKIIASSTQELNEKLSELFNNFKGGM